jgi:hypothetical protein
MKAHFQHRPTISLTLLKSAFGVLKRRTVANASRSLPTQGLEPLLANLAENVISHIIAVN